jgi:hypothetical protein
VHQIAEDLKAGKVQQVIARLKRWWCVLKDAWF